MDNGTVMPAGDHNIPVLTRRFFLGGSAAESKPLPWTGLKPDRSEALMTGETVVRLSAAAPGVVCVWSSNDSASRNGENK